MKLRKIPELAKDIAAIVAEYAIEWVVVEGLGRVSLLFSRRGDGNQMEDLEQRLKALEEEVFG